jgi:tetratricopeptide (TPR) repeat protein
MNLPPALIEEMRRHKVVLLLGAGATTGAVTGIGTSAPTTPGLTLSLARRFLGGAHADRSLAFVTDLAISESNLIDVQDFIAEQFRDLQPASFHLQVPTFIWRGLATTNFDLVIEAAYEQCPARAQQLVPILSDNDRMDDILRSVHDVALLRLHGSIKVTRDERLPLILTTDQYITHRENRRNLFITLEEWGRENTIVAIGQSLQDPDLRQILLELSRLGDRRPRYYLVSPNATPEEVRFWESGSRRTTSLEGTFLDFLEALDAALPSALRRIAIPVLTAHPIAAKLPPTVQLTAETVEYLTYDLQYVHASMPTERVEPRDFYRGVSKGWSAIDQDLDVRRKLVDEFLYDVVLQDEVDKEALEFYVIKAEAGAGKSTLLKRIAWEASSENLCLFLKPEGRMRYQPIAEIATQSRLRIYLFVDDAADHVQGMGELLSRARRDGLRLTLVTAERINEWNIACERLDSAVTTEYPLRYLSEQEIGELLLRLERNRSLGRLEDMTSDERTEAFVRRAGRQLLVALLEATQGVPLEDILVDEFNHIIPESAQSLYLTVCVMNRLGVPVRAGLIARIHDIPFDEFREKLFAPLEHVVMVTEDRRIRDFLYSARHELIAEVVFERILSTSERRFDEYIRLIGAMNLSYSTDFSAFRQMVRGRRILELFPDHTAAREVFRVALGVAGDDPHTLQQRGIYEMARPNGNLLDAQEYLNKARSLSPRDFVILHSLAELALRRAEASESALQRQKFRDECRELANIVRDDPNHGPFGYHTILKLHIDRLKELVDDSQASNRDLDRLLQEIERTLESGLERFPADEYILSAEAELSMVLSNEERAHTALSTAFEHNRRSPFIANRLASIHVGRGEFVEARRILELALETNPGDPKLHLAYAKLLIDLKANLSDILYHLHRSFTPGDRNYNAQFLYAMYLFIQGDPDSLRQSRGLFQVLQSANLPYQARSRIRESFSNDDGVAIRLPGTVSAKEVAYGFITRDGTGDRITMREEYIGADEWAEIYYNQHVTFEIGFNFFGPVALNVR